ncbi:6601_t:CDS:2 [Funneliformis caledonium]|uniref:6601_t:CDS:1 n=1 Tax=Funneliformis caledonium TaxID=1117310 RepID=A0A9N9C2A5_9GLOM|nr:6601_t:CDS:2 [Funneliformis caledonium]
MSGQGIENQESIMEAPFDVKKITANDINMDGIEDIEDIINTSLKKVRTKKRLKDALPMLKKLIEELKTLPSSVEDNSESQLEAPGMQVYLRLEIFGMINQICLIFLAELLQAILLKHISILCRKM